MSSSRQRAATVTRHAITLVAWYRCYAPRAGGAYDSHHGRRELLAALGDNPAAAWNPIGGMVIVRTPVGLHGRRPGPPALTL
jgi:hypothetical protein